MFVSYQGDPVSTLWPDSQVCVWCQPTHTGQCTMYSVYSVHYIAHCTMHNAQCTMFIAHCTMFIAHCAMHNALHCTALHSAQWTLHNSLKYNMLHFLIACSPSYCILIEMSPFDAICIDTSAVFFTAAVVTYTSDNCLFSLCLWGGRWHGYEDWCPFTGKGIHGDMGYSIWTVDRPHKQTEGNEQ